MSNVPGPNSDAVSAEFKQREAGQWTVGQSALLEPTIEEFSVLSGFERFSFRLVRRMNRGRWKRFWTCCQKTFGAGWIHLSTYNIMNVYGLENIEAASREL